MGHNEMSALSRNSIHKTIEVKYQLSEKGQKRSVLSGGDGMRDQHLHSYVNEELLEIATMRYDGTVYWEYTKQIDPTSNEETPLFFDDLQTIDSLVEHYKNTQLIANALPTNGNGKKARVDLACEIFANGFNCSQAVLAVFCEDFGLDRELAYKIATGFGGGLRQAEVCGAVSGAVMALGLYKGHYTEGDVGSKETAYSFTKQFIKEFKEKNHSIICRELLGKDLSQEQEYQTIKELELFKKQCPNYVADAVQIVEAIVNSEENKKNCKI